MKKALALFFTLALLAMSIAGLAENAVDVTLSGYLNPAIMPDDPSFQMVSDILGVSQLKVHAQDNNLAVLSILLGGSELADASFEADGDTLCINSNLLGDITLAIPMEEIQSAVGQETGIGVPGISQPDFSDVSFDNTMSAVGGLASKLVPLEIGDTWEIDSDKPDQGYELALSGADVKAIANALQQDLQSSSWLANNTFDVNGEKVNGLGVVDIAVNGIGSVLPADGTPAAVAAIGVSQSMGPVYIHLTANGESKTEEKVSPASLEFVLASKTEATKTFNGSLYVTSEGNDSQLCTLYGELLSEGFHGEVEYATIQADGTETPHGAFSMDLAAAQNALDAYFSLFSAAEKENGEYSYEPAGHLHAGFSTGDAVNLVAEFAKSSEDAALVAITAAVTPSEEIASRVTDNRVELLSMTEEQQQTIEQTAMVNAMGLLPTVMQHLPEEAASFLGQLISQ